MIGNIFLQNLLHQAAIQKHTLKFPEKAKEHFILIWFLYYLTKHGRITVCELTYQNL